jgi:DNA-directed RNA polymerase specialized sigma subunit
MRLNEVEELDEMSQQQLVQTHYPTKYLTNMQWRNINYILGHNNSTPEMKNKVKNVIYNYYEDWAFSRVYYFRQKYWYICYQIQLDELKLYAYIGLRKAIINYDSKKTSDFAKYASKYIYNEIFIGVNELLPIYRAFQFYKNKNKYFTVANKYKKSKPKV